MMRKYAFLLMALPLAVWADVKIGYIDSNHILDGYKGKDELKKSLQKELNKWQDEAIKKKQKVENLVKEFESQSLMLSEEARVRKRKEIEQAQSEYEDFIQKIWGPEGLAKKRNDEIMRPFIEKVNLILQKIGKDREYTIIFDAASAGVVYVKEGMDLTDEVITELNLEFAPAVSTEEKTLFWVFKFRELTPEAREWKHGTQIMNLLRAGFVKTGKFKEVKSGKFQDALREAGISKEEEEFTPEEAGRVGKLAEAKIVVIGEVTRVGDKVDITCRVVETSTGMVKTEEFGSSRSGEREDIRDMVEEVVTRLLPKITE